MNSTKLKQHRRNKRHDRQQWTKEARQIFEEIKNSKYCGTDKMRQIRETQEERKLPYYCLPSATE